MNIIVFYATKLNPNCALYLHNKNFFQKEAKKSLKERFKCNKKQ